MAGAERTETYDVDINDFFNVLIDYEAYPDFVDGCDEAEILEQDDNHARVKFSLNLIKKFSYVLDLKYERPNTVSWSFVEGDIFKSNDGEWKLEDLGNGQTKVHYKIDISFKLMVPKMILNKLVNNNLPEMMQTYADQASGN